MTMCRTNTETDSIDKWGTAEVRFLGGFDER